MPSPEFTAVLALMGDASPFAPGAEVSVLREGMEAMMGAMPAPAGMKAEPISAGGVPAEWISFTDSDTSRALLYLHGGGYVIGSIATHRALAGRLARELGCRVLILDYRLAPENPHPAAVEDALAACRFLRDSGIAPDKTVIAGDSAGGGLTVATLLALRDAGEPLPAAAAGLSAWLDLAGTGPSNTEKAAVDPVVTMEGLLEMAGWYLGEQAASDTPTASPLYADPSGLPPLLLQVGEAEVLRDDSTRFAAKAKEAGVSVQLEVWPDMVHVWHAFGDDVPESRDAVAGLAQFLNKHVSTS
ncbi:MAG TPA: alpha/beta hydrolase [Deltaproteobacteria bacterium]|nr:alpha/beta hydrolase [Deltaproteobacteria bacterium]